MLYKYIKNWKYKNIVFTIIGIGLVFLIWHLITISTSNILFPGPLDVFRRFGELFIERSTYEALGGTLLRLLISFLISLALALFFGLLAGINDGFYRILNPLIITIRTLPVAAIIFILIVLLKPRYMLFIITSLTMFPIMYEAMVSGIKNIPNDIKDSIRMDSSMVHPRTLVNIIIPSVKENILLAVVQALGLGMKVALMAEVLVGTDQIKGLGRLIYYGYTRIEMETVLAVALYAIIIIGVLDICLNFLKKKFKKV